MSNAVQREADILYLGAVISSYLYENFDSPSTLYP